MTNINIISTTSSIITEYQAVRAIINKTNNKYKPSNILLFKYTAILAETTKNISKYIALLFFYKDISNKRIIDKILQQKMKISHCKSTINIKEKIPIRTKNKNIFHFIIILCMVEIIVVLIKLLHLFTFQTPIFNSFLTCSNSICLHIGIPLAPCNNIALCVNNNTFLAIDICVNFANNISYIT